jgi:hypothetical protein
VRGAACAFALVAALVARADELATVSVVTPATPSRWSAAAGGLMQLVDPWGDADKAAQLKRMAKEDRFDLARRMQQHVLEALANRGRVALPLAVSRPPELSPGPLARDQLPRTALPGSMVDVSIEWFGLYRSGAFESYRPMVAVSYRVVDAHGDLAQSTRRLYYNVAAGLRPKGGEAIEPQGECAWKSFEELPRERARLWGCMDAALEQVAERMGEHLSGH